MVKLNADPTVAVVVVALVKAGAWPTTIVMGSVASGLIPLDAVIVRLAVPVAVGCAGDGGGAVAEVGERQPGGQRVPVSVIVGVGAPVVVIVTDPPAWFRVKSAAGMVRVGAAAVLSVMVRSSVAVLPETLVAEIDTG